MPNPRNQATAMAKSGMAVKETDCGEMRGDGEGLRGGRRRRDGGGGEDERSSQPSSVGS